MSLKILIVEDEADIVRPLELGLKANGYQCASAEDGETGSTMAEDESVDLVLLDIWLPKLDGYEVLRRIRSSRPDLPVLMLTARDDTKSKVSALTSGADDYLTKPFDFEELLARLQALTRRAGHSQDSRLEAGGVKMDLLSRRVWRDDELVELSSREFGLLEMFLRNPGQVLGRQQILASLWDYSFDPGSNVVDVYVRHLRKKIDRPDTPSQIETVRGAGYRFEPRNKNTP